MQHGGNILGANAYERVDRSRVRGSRLELGEMMSITLLEWYIHHIHSATPTHTLPVKMAKEPTATDDLVRVDGVSRQ